MKTLNKKIDDLTTFSDVPPFLPALRVSNDVPLVVKFDGEKPFPVDLVSVCDVSPSVNIKSLPHLHLADMPSVAINTPIKLEPVTLDKTNILPVDIVNQLDSLKISIQNELATRIVNSTVPIPIAVKGQVTLDNSETKPVNVAFRSDLPPIDVSLNVGDLKELPVKITSEVPVGLKSMPRLPRLTGNFEVRPTLPPKPGFKWDWGKIGVNYETTLRRRCSV